MSFFGFDASMPGRPEDDQFREGPTLGGFEYEDELLMAGDDEEEIQDFLATEKEADVANADTFGDMDPVATAKTDDAKAWEKQPGRIGKEFDFTAANTTFQRKIQEGVPWGQSRPVPTSDRGPQMLAPQATIKSLWDSQSTSSIPPRPAADMMPAAQVHPPSAAPRILTAADVEAQLTARAGNVNIPTMTPGAFPVMPGLAGLPVPIPNPAMAIPSAGRALSLDQVEAAIRQQQQLQRSQGGTVVPAHADLALANIRADQRQQEFGRSMMQRSMADVALEQQSGPAIVPRPGPGLRPPVKMSFGFGGGGGGTRQGGFQNRPEGFVQPQYAIRPETPGYPVHRQQPFQFVSEEERREWERRRRNERYNFIMDSRDRELIARIQLSQLYAADPMVTDFYFQIYNMIKKQEIGAPGTELDEARSAGDHGLTWQQEMLLSRGEGNKTTPFKVTDTMQRRVLEWIKEREERQAKPKSATAPVEHSLGKVSLSSSKTPRQLLQIASLHSSRDGAISPLPGEQLSTGASRKYVGPLATRGVLRRVENVYSLVIELEQRRRSGPAEGETEEDFKERNEELRRQLWEELEVTADVGPDESHPLLSFMTVSKAKKVMQRVMRQLSSEKALAVLTILLSRLSELDVVQNRPSSTDVDLFMDFCFPPLVNVVREAPLRIVNALLRVLLERNVLLDVARTKVGLTILTVLLTRAEAIKGQSSPLDANAEAAKADQDLQTWTELYDYIFASLNGHLPSLFPAGVDLSSDQELEDDTYVWEFLAAMAVGATSIEHQRNLVLDVR